VAEPNPNKPDFESAMLELESLVEKMEQGELSLEESIAHFEKGMALSQTCQSALEQAQLKVDQLVDPEQGVFEQFQTTAE